MKVSEAAELLGVNPTTVWRWVRDGKIAARQEGREWRVERQDVERMLPPAIRARLLEQEQEIAELKRKLSECEARQAK